MPANFDDESNKIKPSQKIKADPNPVKERQNSKRNKYPPPNNNIPENKDHFHELAKLAEQAHQILVKQNNPFRFCIYNKDEEIFIDLVMLDSDGKVSSIQKKNITRDNFLKLVQSVLMGQGLNFEYIV